MQQNDNLWCFKGEKREGTMKQMKRCLSALLLTLTLTACGSKSASYDSESFMTEGAAYDSYNGIAESAAMDMAAEESESADGGSTVITGEKLVYTGQLNIETLGYEETVKSVREYIRTYKGIIESENEWDNDRSWTYTDGRSRMSTRSLSMTLRIPTESFDAFMNDMEGTGKITSRSQSVENISRRYNDNSIEIEALEKQQARLLEMMDAADTVEEMILVEERLSEVQTELNQKKSYQSGMDTDVKYSTIYLNVNEVKEYTPEDDSIQIGGFGKKLKETVEYSAKYFVYFMEELLLVLIRILPFLILAGIIIFAIKKYRKAKGLDPRLFHREKKPQRDWKTYVEEKKKASEKTESAQASDPAEKS